MPDKPKRIQRRRTKGWRMPEGAAYVGRPTKWGNPLWSGFWKDYTATDAVRDYRRWINREPEVMSFDRSFGIPPTVDEIVAALRGKDLACWCHLNHPCHADVLLEIANA